MVERNEDDTVPFTSCVVGIAFDHRISIDPWRVPIVDIHWSFGPKDGLLSSLLLVVVVGIRRISVRMIDHSLEEGNVAG